MEIAIVKWTNAISALNIPNDISSALISKVHSDIGFLSLLYTGQFVTSKIEQDIYKNCVTLKYPDDFLVQKVVRFFLLSIPTHKWIRNFLSFSKNLILRFR